MMSVLSELWAKSEAVPANSVLKDSSKTTEAILRISSIPSPKAKPGAKSASTVAEV